MKWLILIIIGAVVGYWLYQGRHKNSLEGPGVKTVEKKDFYLTPDDNVSEGESSPENRNPRH